MFHMTRNALLISVMCELLMDFIVPRVKADSSSSSSMKSGKNILLCLGDHEFLPTLVQSNVGELNC